MPRGGRVLAVAAHCRRSAGASSSSSQPNEAYALARRLEQFLKLAIGLALALHDLASLVLGAFVRQAHRRADARTEALAEGRLDTRVEVTGAD